MERVSVSFKGDGSFPSPEAEINWLLGFDHGYNHAVANYGLNKKFEVFPGNSNQGWFGNGFAEGVISGRYFVTNRDYPNWHEITYNPYKKETILKYKNGNWIRITEQ